MPRLYSTLEYIAQKHPVSDQSAFNKHKLVFKYYNVINPVSCTIKGFMCFIFRRERSVPEQVSIIFIVSAGYDIGYDVYSPALTNCSLFKT